MFVDSSWMCVGYVFSAAPLAQAIYATIFAKRKMQQKFHVLSIFHGQRIAEISNISKIPLAS